MKARHIALVVLASAFVVTSVASARAEATKQRVQMDIKSYRRKTFARATRQPGALERESGTHACPGDPDDLGAVQRDGQEAFRWECRGWTFSGKRGTLVLRA